MANYSDDDLELLRAREFAPDPHDLGSPSLETNELSDGEFSSAYHCDGRRLKARDYTF